MLRRSDHIRSWQNFPQHIDLTPEQLAIIKDQYAKGDLEVIKAVSYTLEAENISSELRRELQALIEAYKKTSVIDLTRQVETRTFRPTPSEPTIKFSVSGFGKWNMKPHKIRGKSAR